MKLCETKTGERVKIVGFFNGENVVLRLKNVGIKIGDIITVCAVAPFKSAILIKSGNVRVAVAKTEASLIAVEYVE